MSAIKLTKDNFNSEVINSGKTWMVDFWASWCGPCRMLTPTIETIASEDHSELKVGKINVDEQPELAMKYGVMSIPTVVIIKDGKEKARSVGVKGKHELLAMTKV
ncbi:MAG: thioredoxin [Eubacteriales bacterium]